MRCFKRHKTKGRRRRAAKIALGSVRGFMVKMYLEFNRTAKIMIKHIVMWKFKDDVAEADKLEMKRQLEALKGEVTALKEKETELEALKGKVTALRANEAKKEAQIAALTQEVTALKANEGQLDALKSEVTQLKAHGAKMNTLEGPVRLSV